MSNEKRRQAKIIQEMVQEATRRDRVPAINEEVEKIKGCNPTDQSKGNNHRKQINNIISPIE